MATAKAKLQGLSEEYLAELQQNGYFQSDCTRFLNNPLKKVILIETNFLSYKILIVKQILHTSQGDLKLRYGDVKNQMFLRWTQFRNVADTLEMLPKLPNLVVFEFDKTTTDEHDADMFKKLVQRLSMSAYKKIMVMTKNIGAMKSVFQIIDSSILCTLEEEDKVMGIEKNSNSALKLMTETKNLFEAVSKGNLDEVVFFIESGANVDQTDRLSYTPLHWAAVKGHTAVVLKLLQHGAKHLQNSNGDTPLHSAAANGHNETAIIFLEHCSDVNARGHEGWTPLHSASFFGHHVIVKTLIEYDADIEAEDELKRTSLHMAAWQGHEMSVKTLLDYGAQANAKNKDGWTPLYYAIRYNRFQSVKVLFEPTNANLNSKNEDGETLLDTAKLYGGRQIVEYLTFQKTYMIS